MSGRSTATLVVAAWLAATATSRAAEDQRPSSPVTNSLGMSLVLVAPGRFTMGTGTDFNDGPPREVTISRPFYLAAHEVTQAQFAQIMGFNPSWFAYRGRQRPVECVSWFQAVTFCERLSSREKRTYRLPTEAEWEYACRAGQNWMAAAGRDAPEGLDAVAWTSANTDTSTQPVGAKEPNPLGLYDMLGNVYEWCSDWYEDMGYRDAATLDPGGPETSSNTLDQGGKVARGGATLRGGLNCLRNHRCTSTTRNSWTPYAAHRAVGFRVVCELD